MSSRMIDSLLTICYNLELENEEIDPRKKVLERVVLLHKSWSLFNEKAIINFSKTYPTNFESVLDSEGFRSLLDEFLMQSQINQDKNYELLRTFLKTDLIKHRSDYLIRLFKLLTIMNAEQIKVNFPEFTFLYEERISFRALVEDFYTYWRNLERYCILYENNNNSLGSSTFIDQKMQFDHLILSLYRKISNNISMTMPKVYRQIPAGTHVGLIVKEIIWPIPENYSALKWIPFIKETVIEAPFITYPKKNKRDGFFEKLSHNPISRGSIHTEDFLALPIKVGDLLCYVFCHKSFLTHVISLSNLFEIADEHEVAGHKPDLMILFGVSENGEAFDGFYVDEHNDMIVGYISQNERYDYFGYMKKMILTIHNTLQIRRRNLPIHGAMVHLKTRDGVSANIVIVGDSGAGKSESIEAFRILAHDYISDLVVIFDDMGSLRHDIKGGKPIGFGTEIGAFVRLDDLDAGYAFKQLDRSIFMNPDRINARLITPISSYEDIMRGYPVDYFLYANNYDTAEKGQCITFFDQAQPAIDVFKSGKRMAKGTTTEKGLTESYFANPFGPHQNQNECDILMDQFFEEMFRTGVHVGEIKTQLGISGCEKSGPEQAALDLFSVLKKNAKQ